MPVPVAVLGQPDDRPPQGRQRACPQLAAAMAAGQIMEAALLASVPTLSAMLLTGNVGTMELTAATPIMEAAKRTPAYTTFRWPAPPSVTSEQRAARDVSTASRTQHPQEPAHRVQ